MRVLIVDDNHMICCCLQQQIDWKGLGCEDPDIAYSGIEAIEKIERKQPDIVISDVRMPVMDGMEFCRVVSERWPRISLVFMSAYEDFAAAQMAIRHNVKDYILKPFDREQLEVLENTLRSLLRQRVNQDPETMPEENVTADHDIVIAVQNVIREQLASPKLNIQMLGRMFHMSPTYLGRLFQEQTGMKLVDYMTEKRLQYACEQLCTTVRSVKEIAEEAGYSDANYFSRAFRRKTGMSPVEYRVKYRNLDGKKLWEDVTKQDKKQ